jgi:Csm6 HEPN domain
MRQPIPGTERLLILDNPTAIFGDQELESALETFRSGAFAVAHERFAILAESMSEPRRARLLRDIAALYQAWSDLDLEKLPSLAEQVSRELANPLASVSSATERQLSQQLDFMRLLIRDGTFIKVLNFYVLGEHYSELHRTDFATLLYYRTIEGSFQQRLRLRFSDFDCGNPDYRLIDVAEADLLDRYNQVIKRVGWPAVTALPRKIGLMNAAVILHALDDSLLRRIDIRDVKGLSHLSQQAEARNKSVLAHGYQCVTPRECHQLRVLALKCLRGLWALHQPDQDIDVLCETLRFVRDF